MIKFSIIIPTFNSEATLDIALSSVVKQSYSNLEILIIDGLSTDSTLVIAKRYQKEYPNVIITSEEDKGIYDAMNKGIQMAKGEWLYFMGSDDYFYNINVLKDMFDSNLFSKYDVVYGNVFFEKTNTLYDGEFSYSKLSYKNICHQAIFFNRNVFKKIGTFNLRYISHSDWDHNIRWFYSSKVSKIYINNTIAYYSDGGFSSLNEDLQFKEEKNVKLLFRSRGKLNYNERKVLCNLILKNKREENKKNQVVFYKLFKRFLRYRFMIKSKFKKLF